jgi:CRP-like cAMP-binding protein
MSDHQLWLVLGASPINFTIVTENQYAALIESSLGPVILEMVRCLGEKDLNSIEKSPLARKLSSFVALSPNELDVLHHLHQRRRSFVAGRDLVQQGQSEQAAYILSEGWVCSYKLQPDGTRQIIDFQIPGDFLGLRSVLLRTSDHSFEPVTDIQAAEVPSDDLLAAFAQSTRLATAILWAASRDEAMVVEHLVNLGRRDADVRMAHFLLELGSRLALVGMSSQTGYNCPLTQYHLADALGLSAVHVNRILRQLRENGLVTFRNGKVTFDDRDRLVEFALFDPEYLDQTGPLLK